MVTLETSHRLLETLVGMKLPLKELEETLFDLGIELEEALGDVLRIDITTERPDMVSPQGLARVLRAYKEKKNPEYVAKKSEYKVIIDRSVKDIRPCTACAVVKGLTFSDEKIKELIWVQEKLHATFGRQRKKVAIGVYPMEHITFPITFRADIPENIRFRPLESDKEMTAQQILKEHPTGKSYAHLLEGKKKFPFFVDAKETILSLPPIINSHNTGRVTEHTRDIFLECSGFDFLALSQTLNILVCMLQDMGGVIYECTLMYPTEKKVTPLLQWEKRSIELSFVKQMLGLDISGKDCARLLERMMHHVTKIEKGSVQFEVPPIRTDIWHDVDITDDIIRAYGVNNLRYTLPPVATIGNILPENRLREKLTELMIGCSFQQLFTLALTDKNEQYVKMRLPFGEYIALGHATEQSINMVRTWILPEVLKTLAHNKSREFPQNVFEIEEVVIPKESEDVLCENKLKLCAAMADAQVDYTAIKQRLVYILESLGLKEYSFVSVEHASFLSGRAAKVLVGKQEIGLIGELHPQVLLNFNLEVPVCAFEIDVDILVDIFFG